MGRLTRSVWVLFQIFRDVCCHREIMALKVYCRSEANGCQEQMSLQQIPVSISTENPTVWLDVRSCKSHTTCLSVFPQEHLNVCPFFEVPCPLGKCKERMMRKDIPDHLAWKCKYRETTCEFCTTKMPLTDLQVRTAPGLTRSNWNSETCCQWRWRWLPALQSAGTVYFRVVTPLLLIWNNTFMCFLWTKVKLLKDDTISEIRTGSRTQAKRRDVGSTGAQKDVSMMQFSEHSYPFILQIFTFYWKQVISKNVSWIVCLQTDFLDKSHIVFGSLWHRSKHIR